MEEFPKHTNQARLWLGLGFQVAVIPKAEAKKKHKSGKDSQQSRDKTYLTENTVNFVLHNQ